MAVADSVKKPVLEMYMEHPYPNSCKEERRQIFAAELTRYKFLGLDKFLPGARVIDVGCGTAHRVMPIAQHFGVREYVGIDHSTASLAVARDLASELGFESATLVEGDVFNIPYPADSFDIVISQGVLHHTSEPKVGFDGLVKLCKPGGYVDIYLYNKWNHRRHNMQKRKVDAIGGDDIHRRFEAALALYGTKPLEAMSPHEIAGFYDQYCHPHKSDHTIAETLEWFDEAGLEYWGAYPALGFRDFVAIAQFRGSLITHYPHVHTRVTSMHIKSCMALPAVEIKGRPFRRPSLFGRFFWQAAYALQRSRGRYSGGPAFCGKKRDPAGRTR